jgi:hypothetical protein
VTDALGTSPNTRPSIAAVFGSRVIYFSGCSGSANARWESLYLHSL